MRLTVNGVGRLTKDPQLEKSANDKDICKFSIACQYTKEESCFYYCIAYGQRAEFIVKYFKKGKPIHITGEWGQYQSDKDGKKHSYIDVRDVDFVPSEASKTESAKKSLDSEDEDVPF